MKLILQWKDPSFADTDELEALSKNDREKIRSILSEMDVCEYIQLEVDTDKRTVTHVGGF